MTKSGNRIFSLFVLFSLILALGKQISFLIMFFSIETSFQKVCIFLIYNCYILTYEDISQNPPVAHGQVQAHEPRDALGYPKLGHLVYRQTTVLSTEQRHTVGFQVSLYLELKKLVSLWNRCFSEVTFRCMLTWQLIPAWSLLGYFRADVLV